LRVAEGEMSSTQLPTPSALELDTEATVRRVEKPVYDRDFLRFTFLISGLIESRFREVGDHKKGGPVRGLLGDFG